MSSENYLKYINNFPKKNYLEIKYLENSFYIFIQTFKSDISKVDLDAFIKFMKKSFLRFYNRSPSYDNLENFNSELLLSFKIFFFYSLNQTENKLSNSINILLTVQFVSLMNNYNHLLVYEGFYFTYKYFIERVCHDIRFLLLQNLDKHDFKLLREIWYKITYNMSFNKYTKQKNLAPYDENHNFKYDIPEIRVSIEKRILDEIWKNLKRCNITLDEISTFIGINFRSLRQTGHSIPKEVFFN